MRKLSYLLLFILTCFALPFQAKAQETAETFQLSEQIPDNPKVKVGVLDNGLTYYIRENDKPKDIIELRLVVKTGSLQENENQLGLAHFMEHMNFNGTENFKKNELVDYLQSIGVQFGADLNAYTGFNRTVYILPIPTENPKELEKGFQVLEDWAHNAILSKEMIDDERGVILEEYRTGLGAGKRMRMEYWPVILQGSRYAERIPIGTKENIKNFNYEHLKSFYQDWYRPGLMAVIAVGDLKTEKTLNKIKAHFGDIKALQNPRERKKYSIPNHEGTYIAIATDKEATRSQVRLVYMDKGKREVAQTVDDFRQNMVETLFAIMINNRLNELRNSPEPPFVFGYSYHGRFIAPNKQAYQSFAITSETGQLEGLKALLITNKKVKKFGFEQVELERAKKEYIASLKERYKGRKDRDSQSYIGDYMANFLYGSPMPGLSWKYKTAKKLINGIELSEVSNLIDTYLHKDNRSIVLTGPVLADSAKVTKEDVREVMASVAAMKVEPYQAEDVRENLMREEPRMGSIKSRSHNKELGTTKLTLSNGVQVIYKKTDFKDNQILMRAFSYGGTSLFSNEEYRETAFATGGLTEAGIAGLSKTALDNLLAGKNVSVSPYISSLTEGFRGSTTPEDLKAMFQLIHLYFTELNKDTAAFQSYISRLKGRYANLLANPRIYFINELNKFIYGDNPRYIGFPTPEMLEKMNYDLAYKKYQQRFADAGDFTFFFIGDIPVDKLETYAKKYLASLPSSPKEENYKVLPHRPLQGKHKKVIRKGMAPKSFVQLIWNGETEYSAAEDYYLKSLADVLSIRLIEKLREKMGGVYGVRAFGGLSKIPYGSYSFRIAFPTGPDKVKGLIEGTMAAVKDIIKNGPTAEELKKVKQTQLQSYKEDMEENRYWISNIVGAAVQKEDKTAFLDFKQKVKSLTADDIQQVAKKYLTGGHLTGILYPEKQTEAGK